LLEAVPRWGDWVQS